MKDPKLTVIIPTLNRADLLDQALASLYPLPPLSLEIIVSENGGSGAAAAVVQKYPEVTYRKRETTIPMAKHWNLCVKEAKGTYIKILCDDDWLTPGALIREMETLEKNPLLAMVSSAREEFDHQRTKKQQILGASKLEILGKHESYRRMISEENLFGPPSCVMFVKKHFRAFPENYFYAADWAGWILLLENGPAARLPEVGCGFRLHEGNLTNSYVNKGIDLSEGFALRKELWVRLGTPPFLSVKIAGLFCYRFFRRLARGIVRKENPLPALKLFLSEKKESLEKKYPPAHQ
jgi:glycosyltransferase involved in cell wall biosynthesis